MGDQFEVKVEDLTIGSQAMVQIQCDYCGKILDRPWYDYTMRSRKQISQLDACKECCELKANDSITNKYGDYSGLFFYHNDKRVKTNMERYGCENVFANNDIKNKIIESNMIKYGVPYNQQCQEIRSKTMATCHDKYGVDNYVELFKGMFCGENSPNWKGGVSVQRDERHCMEYQWWRKAIFSRDMYTCQVCGAHSGNGNGSVTLHAHHIFNWKDNPESRYDVDNGITLCEKCHLMFHSQFGKRNNTKDQLDEFMNQNELDKKIC